MWFPETLKFESVFYILLLTITAFEENVELNLFESTFVFVDYRYVLPRKMCRIHTRNNSCIFSFLDI